MSILFGERRKLGSGGFSLVELIIVIAIMAILVGVVAATVIPYLEKSRKARDLQTISEINTDVVVSLTEDADNVINFKESYSDAIDPASKGSGSKFYLSGLKELMNDRDEDDIMDGFRSKSYTESGNGIFIAVNKGDAEDGTDTYGLGKHISATYVTNGSGSIPNPGTVEKDMAAYSE
ncbi:MAG: type II secretion system protein [Lachnospiraceae bacterium]|jgi:type IV pilus assembly protein PilA|nr:type II secretion system protein [Lachnospiraceae bacterium]MEE3460946.1 type II secretion system protein [Lachnospiraceae bacterium]